MTWVSTRNILAHPYGWQRPAKTEEWAYERSVAALPDNRFTQMVCFPWATLIDLLRRRRDACAQPFLAALNMAPPKTTLVRATVCQHVWAMDMLPWFKRLKITDLYWPHAPQAEHEIDGIRIHPFPLYAVCCTDNDGASAGSPAQDEARRPYLYSFIGAYQPGLYISPVRQWIFDLPPRPDARVEKRSQWHYEKMVYGEQIDGLAMTEMELEIHGKHSREYASVLKNSIFSLCPSGAGPNSIRLWESIGCGSIPVILADTLRLPGAREDWMEAAVMVKEQKQAVHGLPALLEALSKDKDRLQSLRAKGAKLWQTFGLNSTPFQLNELLKEAR